MAFGFGADELLAPIVAERALRLGANANNPALTRKEAVTLIRGAGLIPCERMADGSLQEVDAVSFAAIRDKVRAGEPLSLEDGVALYEHPNLLEVGALANEVRERLHGDRTFFNRNMHINATNVCEASCMFCSFARLQPGDAGAYTMSHEEAWGRLRARVAAADAITEIHIVNGLHPGLPFDYYTELLAGLKRIQPSIHLKAFTAVEIFYFAKKFGMPVADVLARAARGRPRLAARRRRRDLRARACARRSATTSARATNGWTSTAPPTAIGAALELHDAVRDDRDRRGARRPHAAAARAAGRDGRLPDVHPARLPPRQQRADEAARADRHRGPAHLRGRAPDAATTSRTSRRTGSCWA